MEKIICVHGDFSPYCENVRAMVRTLRLLDDIANSPKFTDIDDIIRLSQARVFLAEAIRAGNADSCSFDEETNRFIGGDCHA